MNTEKDRNSSFELMRIASMFMIVIWHIILHTNMFNTATGTKGYIVEFIYLIIIIHVNSFVLVTGYFQYNKTIKSKKILGLIGSVWFYNIIFTTIAVILNIQKITKVEFLENTSILNINSYWFINYYIALYFLTPYINKMIAALDQGKHRKIIIILFIAFSIIPMITKQRTLANDGRTIISFIFLYLIGAYFGKYRIADSYHFRRNSNIKNRFIFLTLTLFFGILNFVGYRFGLELIDSTNSILKDIGYTIQIGSTNFSNPLVILESVFYFLFFETLDIKNKFISKLGGLTFGIYLIHENYYVCNNIYKYEKFNLYSTDNLVLVRIFMVATILFIISLLIEFFRKLICSKILNTKFMKKIEKKYDKFVREF